jgi:DNA mismatch endonuclease (patch repair protein)
MSRIRAKDTKPEIVVRSLLHRLGFRYRLHVRDLPGCPDIVLRRWRTIILVHGCFWHRHPGCKQAYTPKTRKKFWLTKFQGNVDRDRKTEQLLREEGWKLIIVWECEANDTEGLTQRFKREIVLESANSP